MIGSSSSTAVASSWLFIWNPPSPEIEITGTSGLPIFAPIAPGIPYPIVPRPPDIRSFFFSVISINCAVNIWCCPTSVTIIASSKIRLIVSITSCGVMIGFFFIISGCSSFHSSIVASHFFVSHSDTYSSIFDTASFASATIGTSTCTFFEIAAVSISICTICAFGANEWSFPVILSLNLVPIENNRSHSFTAILHAYAPCIPRLPIYKGCVVGIAPRPITVVTTGTFVMSTSFVNSSLACAILTPPPARNNGFFAFESILIARFNCPTWTCVFGLYPRIFTSFGYSAFPSSPITSFGRSISTGPGLPVLAI